MGTFWLVDTETTGLYADKNQMIEVGMMAIDDDMRILSSDAFFIKHKEYTIDAKALKVNRIDLEMVDRMGITESEAADRILQFVHKNKPENDRLVFMGQNCGFDESFIKKLFENVGKLEEYNKAVGYHKFDLMEVAMYENVKGKVRLEHYNLDSIATALGITLPQNRHRAIYDCLTELQCFQKFLGKPVTERIQNADSKSLEPERFYAFTVETNRAKSVEAILKSGNIAYDKKTVIGKDTVIFKINKNDRGKAQNLLEKTSPQVINSFGFGR